RAGTTPARARLAALTAALCAAALIAPASAGAHPALLQASPTAGLVAPQAPRAIELSLSEAAVPSGSRIELSELAGDPVPLGEPRARSGGTTLSAAPDHVLDPGVYEVRWSALGADGHTVGGRFAFGVAGKHGEDPPGVQALVAYGSRGGPGEQTAAGEGAFSVIARWLGIAAAAFLLGGWALLARLERAGRGGAPGLGEDEIGAGRERWRTLTPPVWALLLLASSGSALSAAWAGAGSQLDLGTLLDSASGRGIAIQFGLLVLITPALVVLGRRPAARDLALAAGGAVVLVSDALVGHVQTVGDGKGLAAFAAVLHSCSAGIWFGGLLALIAVTRRAAPGPRPALAASARAFAPVAAAALAVSVITGVVAALRELDDVYFLRWSGYGNLVIVKAGLVAVAAAIGGFVALRARRGAEPRGRPLALEAGVLALVVIAAAALSGLVPGRGQALPAERGNLLPGPALASAIVDGGPVRVTLAPARAGANVISAVQEPAPGRQTVREPSAVRARLTCECTSSPIEATLDRGSGGAWSADVELPADGTWFARVQLDDSQASAVALPVGVPSAPGPAPLKVLAIADLSGRDAAECRSHLLGVELAVGRLNALGGVDGGRKVVLDALDSGGSATRAAELARAELDQGGVLAMVGACGEGAATAVTAASDAGVPSIVADPSVAQVSAPGVFRLAGDPYAEGYAQAQYIEQVAAASAESDVVRAVRTGTPSNGRLLEGLRAGLADTELKLEPIPERAISSGPGPLAATLDRSAAAAVVLDGDPDRLASDLRGLGAERLDFATAPVIADSSVFSEQLVRRSGAIGRIGALQGATEVAPDSAIAATYARAVPALYPGELPTLDGLRGYVAGLALADGLADGVEPDSVIARLVQPAPFADALLAPWRSDAPAAGSSRFEFLKANFLPPTLIPTSAGGESQSGDYFTDGTWSRVNADPLGPPFEQPVPPLADTS
ncbi:MAG: copper transport protein, partial [Solirubrobacterales bacterium]|nr:copper transport protein [Solirubrobacterales bacterium]